jgi:DNA-binding HxlR family transcriptional regulator
LYLEELKLGGRLPGMRTYGQYCPLAKSLDVIGDRWSLLIVRELLIRGPCRYTDIRNGLPGIATNLLAERLRELEHAGVIRREAAPPPVATTLFHLTPRGEELRAVVRAMASWGLPLLREAPEGDVFRSHWLASPAAIYLTDTAPDRAPIAIEVRTGDQPMIIETVDGVVRARPGSTQSADAIITGPPRIVIDLFAGRLDLTEARAEGLEYEGDPEILGRVQPHAVGRT